MLQTFYHLCCPSLGALQIQYNTSISLQTGSRAFDFPEPIVLTAAPGTIIQLMIFFHHYLEDSRMYE